MAFNELEKKRRKRSAQYHSKFRNKLYFINFSTNNQREEETKVEQLVIFFNKLFSRLLNSYQSGKSRIICYMLWPDGKYPKSTYDYAYVFLLNKFLLVTSLCLILASSHKRFLSLILFRFCLRSCCCFDGFFWLLQNSFLFVFHHFHHFSLSR